MFTHGQPQTVYHCLGNGLVNQFNISNTVYTLTNLQPDTIYKVDCVAYSDEVDPCLEVNVSAKTCKQRTHKQYKNARILHSHGDQSAENVLLIFKQIHTHTHTHTCAHTHVHTHTRARAQACMHA